MALPPQDSVYTNSTTRLFIIMRQILKEEISKIREIMLQEKVTKKEVICDNCGWTWKLSEGGHDKYICHKCNHNNEPEK